MKKELQSKILMPFFTTIALVAFSACGDDNSGTSTQPSDEESSSSVYENNDDESSSSVTPKSSSSAKSSSSVTPKSSSHNDKSSSSSANSSSSVTPESSSSSAKSSSSITACKSENEDKCEYGELVDDRDGKTYRTVKIGDQVWMAENLNYEPADSYCYVMKKSVCPERLVENCAKYGRFYSWDGAMEACPSGWHLPSIDEWRTLFKTVSGNNVRMTADLLRSTTGWSDDDNGTDAFGFTVLPGGDVVSSYHGEGTEAYFWSSTEYNRYEGAYRVFLSNYDENVYQMVVFKEVYNSVRCVMGSSSSGVPKSSSSIVSVEYGELMDSRDGQTYKTVKIGDQVWMAENLNFETASSHCYLDSAKYCEKTGRLYWWADAVGKSEEECGLGKLCSLPSGNIQGVCPDGWHLPSFTEWNTLLTFVGGEISAASSLKSASGWDLCSCTNETGFSALPAAKMFGDRDNPSYDAPEEPYAFFWSSSEDKQEVSSKVSDDEWTHLVYGNVYTFGLDEHYDSAVLSISDISKEDGLSVRCVKD